MFNRFIIYAIASSLFSSIATIFRSEATHTIPPVLAGSLGCLFAGFLSLTYLVIRQKLPSLIQLKIILKPFIILTILRPIVANTLFSIGISMTTGSKAIFLTKMEPYFVLLWAYLLDGKKTSSSHLILLLIHLAGAVLLSIGDFSNLDAAWGDLIIMIAVLSAALSYKYSPEVTKVLSPTQTSTLSETLGGLICLPIGLLLASNFNFSSTINGWIYLGTYAILFYILAVPLLYASLDGIKGWQASALRASGPILALPFAYFFFNEKLTSLQIFGAFLVLLTSFLISIAEKKSTN